MPRYFIEVAYVGTNYSGFQIQDNANSVQAEVEKALKIFYREEIHLTGSSRTDAGVHALSNYFHFDSLLPISPINLYNINALLPNDIVLKQLFEVNDSAHCRFDVEFREYKYYITRERNPFLINSTWFYPYQLDIQLLNQAAFILKNHHNFQTFSKKKTQVKTFICQIHTSEWYIDSQTNCLVYNVKANRFLRGMVKGLVSTMLKVGRGIMTIEQFNNIIIAQNPQQADFSAPSKGLFLQHVQLKNVRI